MKMISQFIITNWFWLLLLLVGVVTCNRYSNEADRAVLRNTTLLDSIRYYKLKNGSVVASKEVLEYNDSQLKIMLENSNKNIKELHKKFAKIEYQINIISKTKIDTLTVVYDNPIDIDFKRVGTVKEPFYTFNYESASQGFKISDLELINDTITFVKGDKRSWLFGKRTSYLDVVHSSPYISDIRIDAIQLKQDKKWYDSTVFKISLGLVGGVLITEHLNK